MVARADVSRHDAPLVPRRHGDGDARLLASTRGRPTFDIEERPHLVRRASPTRSSEIARGEAWGCMDITEPNAGSDMAALAHARRAGRERRLVRHRAEDLHHVRPRQVPLRHRPHRGRRRTANDPFAGLSGLSMFLVKTYDDLPDGTRKRYVTIERVEEKLGHHGSVTAALSFDRAPGAAHRQARRGLQVHARRS